MRFALVSAQLVGCVAAVAALADSAVAQGDGAVRGLYHFVHSTADAERSFAFYQDVLGIELGRSPFAPAPSADTPPPRIVPRADARGDPLVSDLTDTKGARFRTVFMHAPNTSFRLELSEFLDIPRSERPANPWDPGASMIEFAVRDLDAVLKAAEARGAPVGNQGRGAGEHAGWARRARARPRRISDPTQARICGGDRDGRPLVRSSARESRLRSRARQPRSLSIAICCTSKSTNRVPQPRASYGPTASIAAS